MTAYRVTAASIERVERDAARALTSAADPSRGKVLIQLQEVYADMTTRGVLVGSRFVHEDAAAYAAAMWLWYAEHHAPAPTWLAGPTGEGPDGGQER